MTRPTYTVHDGGRSSRLIALASALLLLHRALADCECGYSTTVNSNSSEGTTQQYVFTDLIETNFANISDISKNTDWVRQAFNTTAEGARGTYGEMFAVDNVETQDEANGDGLQITVRSGEVQGMLSGGEIDTARLDVFYGTFRSSVRLTDVNGTVSAFFWYFNNTQEIDMEFLSKDFHTENSSYPVNLVLQSRASEAAGYDASNTGNYKVAYLPFNPSADFHEYRMDFIPGRVVFYADGNVLSIMDNPDGLPTTAGHLSLSQWSNGNPLWSGGPPATDAVMDVKYVKAYFNSSEEARQDDFAARCTDPTAAGAVCAIPAVTPGNDTAAGFFFTGQKNMTDNQTVSSESGVSGSKDNGGTSWGAQFQWSLLLWALFAAAGWTLGL
ncbi:Beta-glucanase [Cytospora mali]|uniref:Beta-glucanase n=1 Tax=Cytospora mali TaxID=578113 RepID=A0A194VLQ6_CYTMA|nr:Beta-glucanase [Valsa mali]